MISIRVLCLSRTPRGERQGTDSVAPFLLLNGQNTRNGHTRKQRVTVPKPESGDKASAAFLCPRESPDFSGFFQSP